MADERERLTELLAECHDDPDLFNSAILGRPGYWHRQREIGESVCRYRITVCYTGNAVGKDYVVGGIIPWWLYTRHGSQVVVTGPSQTVLGSVTWKELRQAARPRPGDPSGSIPLGFTLSQGIKASPLRAAVEGDWGALGYSTTSVERASGQHNRRLLVIVEEASGVPDEIWDAIDSLKYVKLLAIGNPIRATGRFVELIRQAQSDARDRIPHDQAVNAIRISSRESPDAHLRQSERGLADATWIADVERRYGAKSLYVKTHVDAVIPDADSETLIPPEHLDWAASRPNRLALPANHPIHLTRRIAVDLGEGVGRDSSAVLVRDDWGLLEIVHGNFIGLAETACKVKELATKYAIPPERISFDKTGIGRDFPLHLGRHGIKSAIPYSGSGSPQSPDFVNVRTEGAWRLRQRLDPSGADDHRHPNKARPDFAIPNADWWPRLRDELKVLTYDLVTGKTRLLSKEDWLAILGHSPDLGDALIQSFAVAP